MVLSGGWFPLVVHSASVQHGGVGVPRMVGSLDC